MSGPEDVTEYDATEEGEIASALDAAWDHYAGGEEPPPTGEPPAGAAAPTAARIVAKVEWNGDVHRSRGGVREIRPDGMDLRPVMSALAEYRKATGKAAGAAPYRSMRAKSWQAQYRALSKTQRGRAALDRAGVTASDRTRRGWLAGKGASKANQARIADAYESARTAPVRETAGSVERARSALVQAFTEAVERSPYATGDPIRLLGDVRIELER